MFHAAHGQNMRQMVAARLESTYPQVQGTANQNPAESARNYSIASNMRTKDFMGNIYTKFFLPHEPEHAHEARTAEFFRQSAMPWNSTFMATATDAQRLNNNQQASFVKQPQLTIPSSYGQFYAFMHAMAAAFGNINSTGQ